MDKLIGRVLISLLLIFFLMNVKSVIVQSQANIIRIRESGTVEGTNKIRRNGNVYTLTDDITCSVAKDNAFIFIETHNIIIDGAGHTIRGTGTGTAIEMLRRQGVTVKNCNIEGFENGFHFWVVNNFPADSKYWGLPPASNNKILNNNLTISGKVSGEHEATGWAIFLRFEAENNLIQGNTIICEDAKGGISDTGFKNSFINNRFFGCGLYLSKLSQSSGFNNTINGTPSWYLNEVEDQVIDGAGQVFLFNCENITIRNVQPPSNQMVAVQITYTTDVKITKCIGEIFLISSQNCSVYDNFPKLIIVSNSNFNKIFNNTIIRSGVCIQLYGGSSYNQIYENILLNSSDSPDADSLHYSGKNTVGLQLGKSQLGGCHFNEVHDNNLIDHDVAIQSIGSSNNNIYNNTISDSNVGILLFYSGLNKVYHNNITFCGLAVSIRSSNNTFYGNNFIGNNNQVSITHQRLFSTNIITEYSKNNTFDSGFILGGNFWSNYNGTDGDGDGIGDSPFIINDENQDNFPLIEPVELKVIPEFTQWIILPLFVLVSFVGFLIRKKWIDYK